MGLLTLLLAYFSFGQPQDMPVVDIVEVPQADAAQAAPAQPKAQVILEIDAKGIVSGHFKEEEKKTFGTAAKIDTKALEIWLKAHPDAIKTGVRIRADGQVVQAKIIEVLNALIKLKIDKVSFAIRAE